MHRRIDDANIPIKNKLHLAIPRARGAEWLRGERWQFGWRMYVAVIPNRGSPPAILLRESFRENGKTKNRTLANLSGWPG